MTTHFSIYTYCPSQMKRARCESCGAGLGVACPAASSTALQVDRSKASPPCVCRARWVSDRSRDPRYLCEFSVLIIKLVFIFPLICRIIVLICMSLAGLLLASPFPLWTGLACPAGIGIHSPIVPPLFFLFAGGMQNKSSVFVTLLEFS